MSDAKYCYPDTNVLINHFGIKDKEMLGKIERDLTSANMALLIHSPIKGNFDFKHLLDIHYAIFRDIYPFAGQIREVAIAKSNLFCLPQFIRPMADEIFSNLHKDDCLRGLNKEAFIDKLAFYSGEINALHPFREGNGRTQRLFLQELSKAVGYQLLFSKMDKHVLLNADIEAMKGNYEPLKMLYGENARCLERGENKKPSIREQIEDGKEILEARKKAGHKKTVKENGDLER